MNHHEGGRVTKDSTRCSLVRLWFPSVTRISDTLFRAVRLLRCGLLREFRLRMKQGYVHVMRELCFHFSSIRCQLGQLGRQQLHYRGPSTPTTNSMSGMAMSRILRLSVFSIYLPGLMALALFFPMAKSNDPLCCPRALQDMSLTRESDMMDIYRST